MSKMMKASLWVRREFTEGSYPDMRSVKKWIQDGVIAGRVVGKHAWVEECQRFGTSHRVSSVADCLVKMSS